MGRIVETLLIEPEEFDNRFYIILFTGAQQVNVRV
jgi:hypothetical protein